MSRLLTTLTTTAFRRHLTMSASSLSEIPVFSRLSANVVRILGCNPGHMTLQGTNTYIVGTGSRRTLIDTGDAEVKPYVEALDKFLTAEQVEIDRILVTHWHHDHVGGVKDVLRLDRAKNAEVWKYPRSDDQEQFDFPVQPLADAQEFPVDDAALQVVYTPGHTTDHVCLRLSSDDSLFSGDCILGETTAVFEDLYDYMRSLQRILQLRPTVIYPGHGPVVQDPVQKIEHYIQHRQQREQQILDCLRTHPDQALTEMEIVERIYVDTPKELYPAAAYNVQHHLGKLLKEGRVTKEGASEDGTGSKWRYKQGQEQNKL